MHFVLKAWKLLYQFLDVFEEILRWGTSPETFATIFMRGVKVMWPKLYNWHINLKKTILNWYSFKSLLNLKCSIWPYFSHIFNRLDFIDKNVVFSSLLQKRLKFRVFVNNIWTVIKEVKNYNIFGSIKRLVLKRVNQKYIFDHI